MCSSPEGGKGSWEVTASPRKTERWLRPALLFRESQRPVQPQHAAFKPGPRAFHQLAGSPLEARSTAHLPLGVDEAPGDSEEQHLPEPGAFLALGRGADGHSAFTPHSRALPGSTSRGSWLQPSLQYSMPHRKWSGEIA